MRKAVTLCAISLVAVAASRTAADYQERPIAGGGTITGVVRLTGDATPLPPQPVYKQAETCGQTVPDERLVIGKNRELANVVAHLADVPSGKAVSKSTVVMDNAKCAFVPHVVSATVGQTIEFHNSDPFLHDAHALLGSKTLFNVAIPKGRTVSRPLAEAGLVRINCNVRHTWMHAYIFVGENPYHAVSGADGAFTITDVPAGAYQLTVWHELLGSINREVVVEAGKAARVEIDMASVAPEGP